MATTRNVDDIEYMPIYLISTEPSVGSQRRRLHRSIPLPELIGRLEPGEHLYLVDSASSPGPTWLTGLI